MRNSIAYGPRTSINSALGNVSGLFALATASVLGLGAILRASGCAFAALKILGAVYLIFLGWKHLSSRHARPTPIQPASHPPRSAWSFYKEGLVLAVTNPKSVLFFAALFPQFLHSGQPLAVQFTVLTGIFMALSFGTLVAYAFLAHHVAGVVCLPRLSVWANRFFGTMFIGFGASLLVLRRTPVQ